MIRFDVGVDNDGELEFWPCPYTSEADKALKAERKKSNDPFVLLEPGERVCSCERGEECDRLMAQVKKQAETILAYGHAIKNHKRDKEFVLFHFNEFVAGRIDIREAPFVDEIRAMLDDKEEPK